MCWSSRAYGDTFTRWTESGFLLWIHGKRTYILQLLRHIAANRLSNSFLVLWLALGRVFLGLLLLASG